MAKLKNINVKKNGVIVYKMSVRGRTIFPAEVRGVYY